MSGTEEYPKFPFMKAMFGDYSEESHPDVLAEIAKQLRISNLIAFEALTGEKNRGEIRKGLGL